VSSRDKVDAEPALDDPEGWRLHRGVRQLPHEAVVHACAQFEQLRLPLMALASRQTWRFHEASL
jgi:hypothetical protein